MKKSTLQILFAIAMVSVTIAAGVFTIKTLTTDPPQPQIITISSTTSDVQQQEKNNNNRDSKGEQETKQSGNDKSDVVFVERGTQQTGNDNSGAAKEEQGEKQTGKETTKVVFVERDNEQVENDHSGNSKQENQVIKRKPDESSVPKFSEPIIVEKNDPYQPKYVPVNQPEYLQNVRMEGKTYHSRVMGKVEGKASKKDWGIRGSAYFTYVYGVESIGKIQKNDGVTIIEERTFSNVAEDVLVSRYDIGFELPPELQTGINFFCATIGGMFGGDTVTGADAGWEVGETINTFISEIRIPFTDQMFSKLRSDGMLPPELDPERIKNELMMFTKAKNTRILEGKKVKITFKDGQGITRIDPIKCELSQQEVDVIKRTNYVMDHYLFPDQKVAPDSTWDVDGDVFAGFLDPRLHGRVGGKVTVKRVSDFGNQVMGYSKRLRLEKGNISFTDNSSEGQAITGQLSGIKGLCTIPDKYGVITNATMTGTMVYKNVSTDHLLFEAEMTVTPTFEISYECSVE